MHIKDANGGFILGADYDGHLVFESPSAKALVLAAPEMEARLRHMEQIAIDDDGNRGCPECRELVRRSAGDKVLHRPGCELGALLARRKWAPLPRPKTKIRWLPGWEPTPEWLAAILPRPIHGDRK
jgi:hypothetical protein